VHTDETGSSVTYIGYFTAFGERLDVGFRTAYTFAGDWGYRDDGDAGLLHVGARYYDPQVGRFLSRDAVLSEHPYLYCEHEPVNSVDPSGRVAVAAGAVVFVPGAVQVIAAEVIAVGATILIIKLAEDFNRLLDDLMREEQERLRNGRPGTRVPSPPPRDPRHLPPDPKDKKDRISFILAKLAELFDNIFKPMVITPLLGLEACGSVSST
jgi:RHS repeat-associated protein